MKVPLSDTFIIVVLLDVARVGSGVLFTVSKTAAHVVLFLRINVPEYVANHSNRGILCRILQLELL